MRIGISTACYFNRAYTEEAVARIKALGVRETEVFFGTYSEYVSPIIDRITDAAAEMDVHSVHAMCTQFEPQLFAKSPRVLSDAHAMLNNLLSAAQKLNAHHYTFHGLLQLKRKNYSYDYESLAKTINQLTALCATHNVNLCYENVHYSYAALPEFFARMLPLCPSLCTTLDIKQAAQAGIPYGEYIRAMNGRIRTVHACDLNGASTCLPGKGTIDWYAFFCDLKASGFDGSVLLEAYPTDYQDESELRRAYDLLCEESAKAY